MQSFLMWEVGMNFYRRNDKLEVFQTASSSRAVSWNLITYKKIVCFQQYSAENWWSGEPLEEFA